MCLSISRPSSTVIGVWFFSRSFATIPWSLRRSSFVPTRIVGTPGQWCFSSGHHCEREREARVRVRETRVAGQRRPEGRGGATVGACCRAAARLLLHILKRRAGNEGEGHLPDAGGGGGRGEGEGGAASRAGEPGRAGRGRGRTSGVEAWALLTRKTSVCG